jgi:cytochrome c
MKFPIILAAAIAACATAAAAAPSGEAVFKQRCTVCHSIQPAPGKMGPPLAGVAGRKAGTLPGYAYSAAMKSSKLVWTPEVLDTYLKAPGKSVPGTKMLIGTPDAEQRAALVQYLGTLKN